MPAATDTPAEVSEAPASAPTLTNDWAIVVSNRYPVSRACMAEIEQWTQEHPHPGTGYIAGEARWTESEENVIRHAIGAVTALAEDAGVAVQLTPQSYHILPDRDAYTDAWRDGHPRLADKSTDSAAFCESQKGVIIDRTSNDPDQPKGLWLTTLHESVHLGMKKIIMLGATAPDSQWNITRDRVASEGLLDEVTAEMASYRIVRSTDVMDDVPEWPSYIAHTIAANQLILDAADFHGMEPAEIEQGLYRYNFGGDREGLQMLEEGVGPRCMNAFRNLPRHPTLEQIRESMKGGLFSGEAAHQLTYWYRRAPLRFLFEWQDNS